MGTLHRQPGTSSLLRLSGLAAVLGAAAGAAAFLLVHLIAGITNLALLQRWSWEMPPSSEFEAGPAIVIAAVTGAAGRRG